MDTNDLGGNELTCNCDSCDSTREMFLYYLSRKVKISKPTTRTLRWVRVLQSKVLTVCCGSLGPNYLTAAGGGGRGCSVTVMTTALFLWDFPLPHCHY